MHRPIQIDGKWCQALIIVFFACPPSKCKGMAGRGEEGGREGEEGEGVREGEEGEVGGVLALRVVCNVCLTLFVFPFSLLLALRIIV